MSRAFSRVAPDALPVLNLDPSSRIGALARALAAIVTAEVLAVVAEHDDRVRGAHLRVFAALDDGPQRLSAIARRLGTTKQTVAPVVDDLVAWDYLERCSDPADGRAKLLAFTAAGKQIGQAALEAAESLDREWESVVGKDELERCRATLWSLVETRLQPSRRASEM